MPTYRIRGIDVDFPFEAYDCQLVYMEKVIEALQNKCNALLESPTGTGKTLCLLCATLAWRKTLGDFTTNASQKNSDMSDSDIPVSQCGGRSYPTIVYTSRTHSQLRQVIQELKRSNYRPKMVVLGSREQLCVHDQVSLLRGKAQTNACQYLCKKRRCEHNNLVSGYVTRNPHLGEEPIDIEDLVNIGKKFGPCPYYISRELHKDVDILFSPYNYLIDRGYRKSLKIDWNNSILIFDEAHNLESLCADAASFDLPSGLLSTCISEAKECVDLAVVRRDTSNDKSVNPENFAILKALLQKLEKRIAEVPIESKELGFTKPGPYIYELLADLNITGKTAPKLIDIIEEATVLLEEDKPQKSKDTASRLENIGDILKLIFREEGSSHAEFYRVHVQEVEAKANDVLKGKRSRTLSWWCFNPGIAMKAFAGMGVGSIILTSGTLSPMDSFAQEFQLEFPVQLENPHVISSNQLWAGVVPVGPSGHSFNSSYRNRDSLEYKQELGNAIVNFARIVPDGLLVFFPSYYLLDQCIGCWKDTVHGNSMTIWERICKHKKPVVEPRQSSLFPVSIQDYMAKLQDTSSSGAVFFAVCRGKVSEGLDFADHAGRAVVITGMPFATMTDPKVRLKRQYLDKQLQPLRGDHKVRKSHGLTGEDWYNQQASRAVNQAIGRVIRHCHDYGAIIFCDERFMQPIKQSQISRWIQPHVKSYSKFGDVISTLTRFFRDEGLNNPIKLKLKQETNIGPSLDPESLPDERVEEVPSSFSRGNVNGDTSAQPVDKFHLNAFMDKAHSKQSLSSLLEAKRGNNLSKLAEILPANRAFPSPFDKKPGLRLKHSSILLDRKDTWSQNLQTGHISGNSTCEKSVKQETLAACSVKKQVLTDLVSDEMHDIEGTEKHVSGAERLDLSHCFSAVGLVKKRKNPEIFDGRGVHNGQQISSTLLHENDAIEQQKREKFLRQENRSTPSSSTPHHGDKETKGSVYLSQVQGKLNAAEYKEFVGYLRTLKTEAKKAVDVLQSIVRLFSGPERLPLLRRFKDFVPAKYRPLYEQYIGKRCDDLENPTNMPL